MYSQFMMHGQKNI